MLEFIKYIEMFLTFPYTLSNLLQHNWYGRHDVSIAWKVYCSG